MAVLGIDIGTTQSVVASVGRGAVYILRNELSERLTPSLVSYTDEKRLIGDVALSQLLSNCKNTCRNMKNLLGRFCTDPHFARESAYSLCQLAPSENGLIGYKVQYKGEIVVHSATTVLATLLGKLRDIAKKALGTQVQEVVIACPGWFTDIHRSALLAATEIAGLKCLRLLSEHVATALDYGIFRVNHFSDSEPVRVAFISMGHCNSSVCIAEFTKEKLQILGETSDRMLGGRDMDTLLTNFFAEKFYLKTKKDPLKNVKHRLRLEEQATKIKKILSANTEAACRIECLVEDYDLDGVITREEFTNLCISALAPRFRSLLSRSLDSAGLSIEDIHSVEIIGGCTRIPWVLNEITQFFQKNISRTLSADECIARGCALQAAMCSVHFKVKEFGCHERLTHPIAISIENHYVSSAIEAQDANSKDFILMPLGMDTNQRKKLRIKRSGPFTIHVQYANPADLPEGTAPSLGSCLVNLPQTEDGSTVEVLIVVALNFHGQFKFISAFTKTKVNEPVEETSESPPSEAASTVENNANISPEKSDENNEETALPLAVEEKEKVEEKPTVVSHTYVKEEIPFEVVPYPGKYSVAQVEALFQQELNLTREDKMQDERLEKMNEVESSIFSFRGRLHGDLAEYVTDYEVTNIFAKLDEIEMWLYDNYGANKEMLVAKLEEIHNVQDPVTHRFTYYRKVSNAKAQLAELVRSSYDCTSEVNTLYTHVPVEIKNELQSAAVITENFLLELPEIAPLNVPDNMFGNLKTAYEKLLELYQKFTSVPKPAPVEPAVEAEIVNTEMTNEVDHGANCNGTEPACDVPMTYAEESAA